MANTQFDTLFLGGLGGSTEERFKTTTNLTSPLDEIFGSRDEYMPKMQTIANEILSDLETLAKSNIEDSELSVLSQDKNHPAWQFVRQLGIDPSTANTELITKTMEAFNKEISSQISELTKRRNELKQKNPYEIAMNELLPAMIAIGALAPDMANKVMPLLFAMAPKIKERAIGQIENQIYNLTEESTRKNLQAANTLSLIEQRATSAGRLALAYVQEERRNRAQRTSQKIRVFGTLIDQWFKNSTEQLKQKRFNAAQIGQLTKALDQYENLVMRLLANWPILSDRDIQARRMLLDDLNQRKMQLANSLRELRNNASDDLKAQIDFILATRARPLPEQLVTTLATSMENAAASLVPSRIALNISQTTLNNHLSRFTSQRTMTLATETAVGRDSLAVLKDYWQNYPQYTAELLTNITNAGDDDIKVTYAKNFWEYNLSMLNIYRNYMQTYISQNPAQADLVRRNYEGIRQGFINDMTKTKETIKSKIASTDKQRELEEAFTREYLEKINNMGL